MIKAGFAWHYKDYNSDSAYAEAEIQARENRLGLWQDASPVRPQDYRKERRSKKSKKMYNSQINSSIGSSKINNSKIIFKDALKTNINEIEKDFSGNYSIVANLPYYITTPLIFKFIEETNKVDSITIMIQKEVADRLVAKSGKDYGTISIILDFVGEVKFCRKVSRTMFTPAPNVDSAVVRIELNRNKYDANFEDFCKVVRTAFSMRRKTLLNNFSSGLNMTKNAVKKWLNEADISESARAEELSTNDFVKLTNLLKK